MNNTYAVGITLPGLPLQMRCYDDATVSFHKLGLFKAIIDNPETGVQAIVDDVGISIGANTELEYNERYEYKTMPELLSWLIAQKLEAPQFN